MPEVQRFRIPSLNRWACGIPVDLDSTCSLNIVVFFESFETLLERNSRLSQ